MGYFGRVSPFLRDGLVGDGEVNAAHLPRGHLAVVAHVRVEVALDRVHGRVGRQEDAVEQAVLVVSPQARREGEVAGLIVPGSPIKYYFTTSCLGAAPPFLNGPLG